MAEKKRTIPKKQYDDARKKGDVAAAKLRREITDQKGKEAVKDKHVDHVKPIAKGGSPSKKKNLKLIPAKQNLQKGTKNKKRT